MCFMDAAFQKRLVDTDPDLHDAPKKTQIIRCAESVGLVCCVEISPWKVAETHKTHALRGLGSLCGFIRRLVILLEWKWLGFPKPKCSSDRPTMRLMSSPFALEHLGCDIILVNGLLATG